MMILDSTSGPVVFMNMMPMHEQKQLAFSALLRLMQSHES